MEISILQSLIDRKSNEISKYERYIEILHPDEPKQVSFYKKTISKLVKIQKALKKEIANELKKIAQQRFYDSM